MATAVNLYYTGSPMLIPQNKYTVIMIIVQTFVFLLETSSLIMYSGKIWFGRSNADRNMSDDWPLS